MFPLRVRLPAGRSGALVYAAGLLGVAAVAVAGLLTSRYLTAATRAAEAALARAQAQTNQVAAATDSTIRSAVPAVDALAQRLGVAGLTERDVLRALQATIDGNQTLIGAGVAFEPQQFTRERRLYAPYLRRAEDGPARLTQLDQQYDYTQFRHRWYGDVILDGPTWAVASLDAAERERVVLYGVPIFPASGGPEPAGVAFAAILLDRLAAASDALRVGTSGYVFAFAKDGHYLHHPRRELVEQGQTVFETAWESGNTSLNSMAVRAVKGETGFIESLEPLTGETNWIFYAPIPTTGWTLASVFIRREFEPDDSERRRALFLIVLCALAGAGLLGIAVVSASRLAQTASLWTHSTAVAVLLTAGVAALWWIADRHPDDDTVQHVRVLDRAGVEQFLGSYVADNSDEDRAGVLRIPTGIFVRSIAFQSSTDVAVSGFVWQRYTRGVHDGVTRGVTLPEAEGLPASLMTEIYRIRVGNEERVAWQFAAKLRQDFSYRKYPFDRQHVWVRLRPVDFRRDVVLVPDFDSYRIMNPAALPGLARDLVLPGWEVLGSHFDYRLTSFNADFGVPAFAALEEMPELYFNASLRRLFIGPFVSYIVPVSVTIAMVFAVLVISSRRDKATSLLGFSSADSLRSAAALFFVASFQHVALRNTLASPVIMYFEYFYFAVYIAIMFVSMNAIVFGAQLGLRVFDYRDNLIPKVLFFPLYATAMFLITYVIFH